MPSAWPYCTGDPLEPTHFPFCSCIRAALSQPLRGQSCGSAIITQLTEQATCPIFALAKGKLSWPAVSVRKQNRNSNDCALPCCIEKWLGWPTSVCNFLACDAFALLSSSRYNLPVSHAFPSRHGAPNATCHGLSECPLQSRRNRRPESTNITAFLAGG